MIHQLLLSPDDFIAFQLYDASTDPLKIKTRRKSYFTIVGICLAIMLLSYLHEDRALFYTMMIMTVITSLFYGYYQKNYHKSHYIRHVKHRLKDVSDFNTELEITEECLITRDKTGESNIKLDELIGIAETGKHFFIKAITGHTLVLPKTSDALNLEIAKLVERKNITYTAQLNWKWA